ncbi:MAG: hypothetical protein V7784_10785 [Oceanospirillaceae bacterium]
MTFNEERSLSCTDKISSYADLRATLYRFNPSQQEAIKMQFAGDLIDALIYAQIEELF